MNDAFPVATLLANQVGAAAQAAKLCPVQDPDLTPARGYDPHLLQAAEGPDGCLRAGPSHVGDLPTKARKSDREMRRTDVSFIAWSETKKAGDPSRATALSVSPDDRMAVVKDLPESDCLNCFTFPDATI